MSAQNHEINDNFGSFFRIGYVWTYQNRVITITGLPDARLGELVRIGSEQIGQISEVDKETVRARLVYGRPYMSKGDIVISTGSLLYVPIGSNQFGRVIPSRPKVKAMFETSCLVDNKRVILSLVPVKESWDWMDAFNTASRDVNLF